MKTIIEFTSEVKKFSKANWWVYIIYSLMLWLIFFSQRDRLPAVFIVTSLHFTADIFIMMMLTAYTKKSCREGTVFQIMSLLIFLSLKLYTGISGGGWHYILADPIYILAALKNYRIDVKQSDLPVINNKTLLALSILILFLVISVFKLTVIKSSSEWTQTAGIFLFAIALSTTKNEQLRYLLSLVALTLMVVGSFAETMITWSTGKVVGLAISYTLLPLTVLVFYLNNWGIIMSNKKHSLAL